VQAASEALLWASHTTDGPLEAKLVVSFEDAATRLVVAAPGAFADADDRVSRDLIEGYVRQLRGRLAAEPDSGTLTIVAPVSRAPVNEPSPDTDGRGLKFFRVLNRTHG
jgi:hypothetical protein